MTDDAAINFPPEGLVYFWFLNDDLRLETLRRQLAAFARARVGAVVLHPRAGNLVPYGSDQWFGLIRTLVHECVAAGVQPWLYDEDPYPSGSAGGWITAEHPELRASAIDKFDAPAELREGELFFFPTGRLLWAGAVPPEGETGEAPAIDLTAHVGILRRHWDFSPWDSRWYYPAAPLYDCPRSETFYPEFALRKPTLPPGWRLSAFVARPAARDGVWGAAADSLNPRATELFLQRTHERYARTLGDLLGRAVPAIFTDEPKYHAPFPWTPDLFDNFREQFGYDLRPRLAHLFTRDSHSGSVLTRLHYRQWCGQRFIDAWLEPVSKWCHGHGLKLVGHVSPEDDLVQQSVSIGNGFPLQRHLDLAGLDLIIPAVGDARHAILNVGQLTAVSAVQQMDKPGAMSETLACSGVEFDTAAAAKILAWQTLCGIGTIVVHGAFASSLGLRKVDAPPDFGPDGSLWQGMCNTDQGLRPFQRIINGSDQIAPVAVLWPVRSFQADSVTWLAENTGPRKDLNDLLLACLDAQIGVHLLDEAQLASAEYRDGRLHVGRARYQVLLLPSTSILHAETLRRLEQLHGQGFRVYAAGQTPRWSQQDSALKPVAQTPWSAAEAGDLRRWCREQLPALLPLEADDTANLRATGWIKGDQTTYLLMNLDDRPRRASLPDTPLELAPGQLIALRRAEDAWHIVHSFDPRGVTPAAAPCPSLPLTDWEVRWPGSDWRPLDRPLAVYQLGPPWHEATDLVHLMLTGPAFLTRAPVAEYVEFRATLTAPDPPPRSVTLVLEPTAQRGAFTLTLGNWTQSVTLADTDTAPVRLELTTALRPGPNELHVRLHNPTPFDGIRTAPVVEWRQ